MNTGEIIKKSREGDQAAFGLLYDTYAQRVFSTAFRILGNEEDAGDVVQETFIRVWKNLHQYNPEKEFRAWITRIAVNKCYDMLRKAENKAETVRDDISLKLLISGEKEPDVILDNKELGALIRTLTNTLSPKQKIVFVLIDLEGHTHDEAEEISGMDKSSIKSNLNHARRKIASQIKKHDIR